MAHITASFMHIVGQGGVGRKPMACSVCQEPPYYGLKKFQQTDLPVQKILPLEFHICKSS